MRRRAWLWCLLAGLMAIHGCWRIASGRALETDLLAMLPATERNPVAETALRSLAQATAGRAVFLVRGGAEARGRADALAWAGALAQSGAFQQVQSVLPGLDPAAPARFYASLRFRLPVPPGLDLGDARQLRQRMEAGLLAPQAGLAGLSAEEDPLGCVTAFLAGLPYGGGQFQPQQGLLRIPAPEGTYTLVSAELPGSAYDPRVQDRVLAAVQGAEAELGRLDPGAAVLRTGLVFHAADARRSAEREAGIISTASMACIFLLYLATFRTARHLLLGLACVAAGLATAVSSCLFLFGRLHLMTVVVGASVLGVAVDYSFLYFAHHLGQGRLWRPGPALARLLPALLVGLGTTLLGYAALLPAPFPGLRQIAVFSMAGLCGAFLTVCLVLPDGLPRPASERAGLMAGLARLREAGAALAGRRWWPWALVAAGLILAAGALRARVDDDVHVLIQPSPLLMAQEAAVERLTGFTSSPAFFLVEGADAGTVLAREEALRRRLAELAPGAVQAVSCLVPSPAAQETALARWRQGLPALAQAMAQLGFRPPAAAAVRAELAAEQGRTLTAAELLAQPFAAPFRRLWLGATVHGTGSVLLPPGDADGASLRRACAGLAGVTLVDKARSVSDLLGRYRRIASWALAAAVLLVWSALGLWRGARAAAAMTAPALLGMLAALAGGAWLGFPVTLFTVMAMTLLLGFGVDYTVFLREGDGTGPSALLGVLLAASATLVSYGLLACSHTPALRGFGLTLALGVSTTALLSFTALRPAGRRSRAEPGTRST